jgi:hypothetical protein
MPRLCAFYPGTCLTTEEKQGETSVRVAIHKHTIRIHSHNKKNKKNIKISKKLIICSPTLLTQISSISTIHPVPEEALSLGRLTTEMNHLYLLSFQQDMQLIFLLE